MNSFCYCTSSSTNSKNKPDAFKQTVEKLATTAVCILQSAFHGGAAVSTYSHAYSGKKPSKIITGYLAVFSTTSESCDSMEAKEQLRRNLQKLQIIKALEKNWNGYNAEPINPKITEFIEGLLPRLYAQPDVFPTGRDTIQLEYEKTNGDYLEFEIAADEIVALHMDPYDEEREWVIRLSGQSIEEINKAVKEFYGIIVYEG